jgi:predicted O-methyltransferase YrrM
MSKRNKLRCWLGIGLVVFLGIGITHEYIESAREAPEQAYAGLDAGPALQVVRRMGRGHGVTATEGRYMYDLIVRHGYTRGLDIGTAHGYSALWFGMAVSRNGGSLVTIELDPATAEVARTNFREARLDTVIDSRLNDAFQEIPRLEGGFDFVFIDTGTMDNQRFFDLLGPRITRGGAVMAHNAGSVRWLQRGYWNAVTNSPDWETTVFESVAVSLRQK